VLAAPALALLAAGACLAGCGSDPDAGTNGEGKLSATRIHDDTVRAAKAAPSVRLSGTVISQGGTYRLDMRLRENGGIGTVTTKSSGFQLLRVDDHLFLKASSSWWRSRAGSSSADAEAAGKLGGKYVRVPTSDSTYKQLSGFTDKDRLLDGLLTLHGSLGRGDHGTTDGIRTIAIDGDGGDGGTLEVSLEHTPYPVRLERANDAGTLTFSDWGKAVALEEPAKDDTVDYGSALPTS
jgi:hypothetical protein